MIILYRYKLTSKATLGILYTNGKVYRTLEPPWLNNKTNESCIPAGTYTCKHLPRSGSGKYSNVYHLQDVKDRTGILIHAGNLPKHTLGCILMGKKHGKLAGQDAVLNSKSTLTEFVDLQDKKDFTLIIIGNQLVEV